MRSFQVDSKDATPKGSVNQSRSDRIVCVVEQGLFGVCFCVQR